MLLIRGDTRVADIYMTEFDRIFRHFYFRDIAGELAGKGDEKSIFLDEDGCMDRQPTSRTVTSRTTAA